MVGYIEGAQIKHLDTDVGQKGAHASVWIGSLLIMCRGKGSLGWLSTLCPLPNTTSLLLGLGIALPCHYLLAWMEEAVLFCEWHSIWGIGLCGQYAVSCTSYWYNHRIYLLLVPLPGPEASCVQIAHWGWYSCTLLPLDPDLTSVTWLKPCLTTPASCCLDHHREGWEQWLGNHHITAPQSSFLGPSTSTQSSATLGISLTGGPG